MWKVLATGLGILAVLFSCVFAYFYFKYLRYEQDFVAEYLLKNPKKCAIYWVRNDSLLVNHRADTLMPLASTVKIIVAIEFAQQAAEGKINVEERVPISEPGRFYIPDTDGGAHPAWLESLKKEKLLIKNTVSLLEIAKGMMQFSSNANTEYLMWKLGLNNINANLPKLGLVKHQLLYPFVSALYVCSDEHSATGLKKMPMSLYLQRTNKYFELMKVDTGAKATFNMANVPLPVQRIWSDRLPSSTVQEYAGLMKKINSRTYFNRNTQAVLDQLMEWPMRFDPANKKRFVHFGAKGGSTAFVLNYALYATDKQGNKTEMVIFTNNLGVFEQTLLQAEFQVFIQKILINNPDNKAILSILKQLN
ncbi:serine hydrolase [Runella sp.]|uniref:serine hydrolase n=1 Tax=Runella sp. TaxID=1960881 RepID=UPI003D0C5728